MSYLKQNVFLMPGFMHIKFLNMHWYGDIMDTRVIDCNKTRRIITSCASLIINRKTKQIYLFRLKSKTLMSNIGNVHVA